MWLLARSPVLQILARPPRPRRWAPPALALVVCVVLAGCKIVLVSGPSTVAVGDTVSYVVALSSNDGFLVTPFYVVADVPVGWDLESNAWEGTVGGLPAAETGLEVDADVCERELGDLRPGYHRMYVRPTSFSGITTLDTGEVTLEFTVGDQPAGQFEIFFAFGSNTICAPRQVLTVNRRGPRLLASFQELFDGAGGIVGLRGPREAAPSPDGRRLYVAAGLEPAVTVLDRGAGGELTWNETQSGAFDGAGALGPPVAVRASPDGAFVYVASAAGAGKSGGIATFARHPATGALTYVDRVLDDVESLVVSPDGRHLYAASADEVSVYWRDEVSGLLTFFETISPGGELAMSSDGRHLYATNDAVTLYGRDAASGQLIFLDTGPGLSADMTAISPDERHLYSVAARRGTVVAQERDPVTGALSPVATIDFVAGLGAFPGSGSVAVSPDGSAVVASSIAGLTLFWRDPASGVLTFAENHFNGDLPADGLWGPRAVAFVPGTRHLYAVGWDGDALLAFRTLSPVIFGDGFDSSSTSAWTSASP